MIKESYKNTQRYNKYYIQKPITESDMYSEEYKNSFSEASGWEKNGLSQLNVLIRNGLQPNMKLLEIGCGYLRGGSHIINYLDPYNYYAIEVNKRMLYIGLNNELKRKSLQHKVKEENFVLSDHFDMSSFETKFDFGFANSVFTTLPLNHMIYFLNTCQKYFKKQSKIIISLCISEENESISDTIIISEGGKVNYASYLDAPYFHKKEDLYSICNRPDIEWSVRQIEGFQQMNKSFFLFERL